MLVLFITLKLDMRINDPYSYILLNTCERRTSKLGKTLIESMTW